MAIQPKARSWPKILLYVFIAFVLAAAILLGVNRYEVTQKYKEIQEFISKVVDSAREDTAYYKENSKEDVVVELQNNRNIMTGDYTVSIIDYTWGVYEARISFVNKIDFHVSVVFRNENPFLWDFRRLKK